MSREKEYYVDTPQQIIRKRMCVNKKAMLTITVFNF